MNSTSLAIILLEGMVDLVVDCCHSHQSYFGSGRGRFIVIVEVNDKRVPAIYAVVEEY